MDLVFSRHRLGSFQSTDQSAGKKRKGRKEKKEKEKEAKKPEVSL